MIAPRAEKDLRLMLQTAKGVAVQDPVTVPLKIGTERTGLFGTGASP